MISITGTHESLDGTVYEIAVDLGGSSPAVRLDKTFDEFRNLDHSWRGLYPGVRIPKLKSGFFISKREFENHWLGDVSPSAGATDQASASSTSAGLPSDKVHSYI